jgi:hypothetical protein
VKALCYEALQQGLGVDAGGFGAGSEITKFDRRPVITSLHISV